MLLFALILSVGSLLVASAMRASWDRLPVGASGRRSGLLTGTQHTSLPIRHHRAYATSIASDDVGHDKNAPLAAPSRCSSYDAASLIRNCTADDGLLVVTCDASGRGGGAKHDGIASILRMRHAAANGCSDGHDVDLIDVAARRTVPSRTSSEVAAIALGMKRALSTVPSSRRKQVLILTDSEYSLDFYCGSENAFAADSVTTTQIPRAGNKRKRRKGTAASMKGRGQSTKGSESREEAHRRSLVALMGETPDGILYSKVRSSSRGVGVNTADEDAAFSWDGVGFIDHDAADHLSSVTRTVANSYDESGEVSFRAVKPLSEEDLLWLTNSDTDPTISAEEDSSGETSGFWQAFEVIGSDARQYRRQRNRRKTEAIEEMLGS